MADGVQLTKPFALELQRMVQWWRRVNETGVLRGLAPRSPVPNRIVRFELTEDMQQASGDAHASADAAVLDDALEDTGETIHVVDRLDAYAWAKGRVEGSAPSDGYRGYAAQMHDTGEWEIVSVSHGLRAVLLKTTLHLNQDATGWPLTWSPSGSEYESVAHGDTSSLITVSSVDCFALGYDDKGGMADGMIVFVNSDNVVVGGPRKTVGKLDGTLSPGGTVTVSVWASGADTGVNLTNVSDWMLKSGSTAVASGKKVVCEIINKTWYVTAAECA